MQDRIKPLKGVENFRDFGGYKTRDGARVKSGKLYRTAALHRAHDEDVVILNGMGIDFQVDLRRSSERRKEPNIWAPHEVHTFNDQENVEAAHIAFLNAGKLSAQDALNFMINYYIEAPWVDSHVDLYTRWFKRLADVPGAGLINCAAGKDRTGLGCALTLSLLGVDEDTVFEDYVLTNKAVNLEGRLPKVRERWEKRLGIALPEDEALLPFLGVKPDYLHAAFAQIRERCGTLENYAQTYLDVQPTDIEKLKQKLIE